VVDKVARGAPTPAPTRWMVLEKGHEVKVRKYVDLAANASFQHPMSQFSHILVTPQTTSYMVCCH